MRLRGLYRRTAERVVTYDRDTGAWELVAREPEDGDLIVRPPRGEEIPEAVRELWRRAVGLGRVS